MRSEPEAAGEARWTPKALGDLLDSIDAGNSPSCPDTPAATGEWGVLKVSAVRPEGFRPNENKVVTNARLVDPRYEVMDGDLLITRANTPALVGLTCFVERPRRALLLCDKTLRLNVNAGTDKRYVFFASQMPSFRRQIEMHATGTSGSMKNISQAGIRSIQLDIPPLPEQHQIAEVLDTVDEAIRKTEQIIAKLKQLKQGLLHDLLTRGIDDNGELRDPDRHPEQFKDSPLGRIPKAWEARELIAMAEIIDPNPSHRYPPEVREGVPIASTENFIGDDGFDLSSSKHVPHDVFREQDRRCHFDALDVVFARKGRIGFARPYGDDAKVFSHTVVLMKPRSARSTHRFLLWSVRAARFFTGIRDRMNFNVGVPTLGVGFLGRVPIAAPPLGEQVEIGSRLDAAASRIDAEVAELAKLSLLKRGLMEDLLTGRVRVTKLLEDAAE